MANQVPSHWVGVLRGNPKPKVLPCGHVILVAGIDETVTEFGIAREYAAELNRQLEAAESLARDNNPITGI